VHWKPYGRKEEEKKKGTPAAAEGRRIFPSASRAKSGNAERGKERKRIKRVPRPRPWCNLRGVGKKKKFRGGRTLLHEGKKKRGEERKGFQPDKRGLSFLNENEKKENSTLHRKKRKKKQ